MIPFADLAPAVLALIVLVAFGAGIMLAPFLLGAGLFGNTWSPPSRRWASG